MEGPNTRINHANPSMPPIKAMPCGEVTVHRDRSRCAYVSGVVSHAAKRLGGQGTFTGKLCRPEVGLAHDTGGASDFVLKRSRSNVRQRQTQRFGTSKLVH
jgi:hypothetical protein